MDMNTIMMIHVGPKQVPFSSRIVYFSWTPKLKIFEFPKFRDKYKYLLRMYSQTQNVLLK